MIIRSNLQRCVVVPVAVHPHDPKEHLKLARENPPRRDSITLLPGINEVDEEEWEHMKVHLENPLATGDISVVTSQTPLGRDRPPREVHSIRDFEAKKAVALIAETVNPETLQRWYVAETRDEVRSALREQMEKLRVDRLNATELENKIHPGTTPVVDMLSRPANGEPVKVPESEDPAADQEEGEDEIQPDANENQQDDDEGDEPKPASKQKPQGGNKSQGKAK